MQRVIRRVPDLRVGVWDHRPDIKIKYILVAELGIACGEVSSILSCFELKRHFRSRELWWLVFDLGSIIFSFHLYRSCPTRLVITVDLLSMQRWHIRRVAVVQNLRDRTS